MFIDTHTHFNFQVFERSRHSDWLKAQELGVSAQFVMSVSSADFQNIPILCEQFAGSYFALGIHPLFIHDTSLPLAISALRESIERNIDNQHFIGIGEIGLDARNKDSDIELQIAFFTEQLKLARDYNLPVFLHICKAQDSVLKYCRQFGIKRGIAHAFNGSHQQANNYLSQGFKLGFGGAFTFDRAKQLRRLITDLPLDAFVLETDCPDMPPAWAYKETNYSYHLPQIAQQFADIRQIEVNVLAKQIKKNTESIVK